MNAKIDIWCFAYIFGANIPLTVKLELHVNLSKCKMMGWYFVILSRSIFFSCHIIIACIVEAARAN